MSDVGFGSNRLQDTCQGHWRYLLSLEVVLSTVDERLDSRIYMNDYRDFESEFGNGTCN